MAANTQRPGLCVVVAVEDAAAAGERLAAALRRAGLACAILSPVDGVKLSVGMVGSLVHMAQNAGVAALIEGDAALARTVKADGVHLPWSRTLLEDYRTARDVLDGRAIVGGDAGASRHDAMALGEAGASYVGFGHAADRLAGRSGEAEVSETTESQSVGDPVLDTMTGGRDALLAWWAEIFEVPCVAFEVGDAEEAAAVLDAGADFVAIRIDSDADVDLLATVAAMIDSGERGS